MSVSLPWPNCPLPLYPQHFMPPSSSRTQVCSCPVTTCTAVHPAPSSTTGRLSPISSTWSPISFELPSPSAPRNPEPQHLIAAVSSLAQVCIDPRLTSAIVRPVPRSTVGRWSPISLVQSPMLLVCSKPSCPNELPPQHLRVPSSSLAQV